MAPMGTPKAQRLDDESYSNLLEEETQGGIVVISDENGWYLFLFFKIVERNFESTMKF